MLACALGAVAIDAKAKRGGGKRPETSMAKPAAVVRKLKYWELGPPSLRPSCLNGTLPPPTEWTSAGDGLIHIAFFDTRPHPDTGAMVAAAKQIRLAGSSELPLRFHVLLKAQVEVPGMQRTALSFPPAASCLFSGFSRLAHGPGPAYLYKPLLHFLLPTVKRLILLDTDTIVLQPIGELWAHFGRFPSGAVLGVANEQTNMYQKASNWEQVSPRPHHHSTATSSTSPVHLHLLHLSLDVRHFHCRHLLRHLGRQEWRRAAAGSARDAHVGRLQPGACHNRLRHHRSLRRPRARPSTVSPNLRQVLDDYAAGTARKWIGYLGDQTFYTHLATPGGPLARLVYTLPCEWNRQISMQFGFRNSTIHTCPRKCALLHANYRPIKCVVGLMQRRPSCEVWRRFYMRSRPELSDCGSAMRPQWAEFQRGLRSFFSDCCVE